MKNDFSRLFIALDLATEIKNVASEIQKAVKPCGGDIKWVDPHNIHLTLKFIGDAPISTIPEICAAAKASMSNFSPFDLTIDSLGWFPEEKTAQVLWMGIGPGADKIQKMAQVLTRRLEPFCEIKENKKFTPHITIGRIRSDKNLKNTLVTFKDQSVKLPIHQKINRAILYKSFLASSGPEYSKISEIAIDAI